MRFTLELLTDTKHILFVTTYDPNMTGLFAVTVFGSNTDHLEPTSKWYALLREIFDWQTTLLSYVIKLIANICKRDRSDDRRFC